MRQLVEGILLKRMAYSETSLITTFYTKQEGLQTFLFQGGKKKKGNSLQPLSRFELAFFKRPDSELGKITTIQSLSSFQSIPFHPVKSGIAFFLAELLEKCLRSVESDKKLYEFLIDEIQFLDENNFLANYPIWFMIQFTAFLGIEPLLIDDEPRFFDVEEGELLANQPTGHIFIKDETIPLISFFLKNTKEITLQTTIPKVLRKTLQENLLDYYKRHVAGFGTLKSWQVLQEVFS